MDTSDDTSRVASARESSVYGKFVCVRKLGAGGMGEVWKAWDRVLRRWVAVKFLLTGGPDEIARFEREAQVAGRLAHPHIAAVYETGEANGRHFIAMQFVEGTALKEARGDRAMLVRLAADAARALSFAHERGVVHRDVKPENLMVGQGPRGPHVFVMDFGLARPVSGANLSMSGLVVGTPSYMPPEQAMGGKVDGRADVYALGATLYEALTGRRVFEGATVFEVLDRVRHEEPRPLQAVDPTIDDDLETVVLKCLEKDAGRRYATASELADDLERVLDGEPILARRASLAYRVRKRIAKRAGVWIASSAGVVAVAALAIVLALGSVRASRYSAAMNVAMGRVQAHRFAVATGSERAAALGSEAEKALDAAIAIDDRQAGAWVWLGRGRRLTGGDAGACWARALAIDPRHAEALFERGRERMEQYMMTRDSYDITRTGPVVQMTRRDETPAEASLRERAEADLAAARATGLASDLAGYLDGLSAYGRGDFSAAEAAMTRYIDGAGWDTQAFCCRGVSRIALGRLEAAAKDFHRVRDLDPKHAYARISYAILLCLSGKLAEAEAEFDRIIELHPRNADAWRGRGALRFERERYDDAVRDFSRAIELDPTSQAYNNRANALLRAGRYGEADVDLDRALSLDGRNADARVNRAQLLIATRRSPEEAEAELTRALEIDPHSEVAWRTRGILRAEQDRRDEAHADLSEAIRCWPGSMLAHYNRGLVQGKMGRSEEAMADLDRAIAIEETFAPAWSARGKLKLDLGRAAEAEADFTKALSLQPGRLWLHHSRGVARGKARRWADAEADFTAEIEIQPGNAVTWRARGHVRYEQSKFAEAAADWEHAVTLDATMEAVLRPMIDRARRGGKD